MNQNPISRRSLPHIRFWTTGQIAVNAKERIDQLLLESRKVEVQAMINEWVMP
jgi:hypothetical protein